MVAKEYRNRRGEALTTICALVPLEAKNEARARRLNLSAICSKAIVKAVAAVDD